MSSPVLRTLLLVILPLCLAQSPSMSPLAAVSTPAPAPLLTVTPTMSPLSSAPTTSRSAHTPVSAPGLPSSPPSPEVTTSTTDMFPPFGAPVASMPGSGASSQLLGIYASSVASFIAGALMFV